MKGMRDGVCLLILRPVDLSWTQAQTCLQLAGDHLGNKRYFMRNDVNVFSFL